MKESTYLVFRKEGESASGRTEIHSVNSRRSGEPLGLIQWYSPWRQYCFFPDWRIILNRGCLEDINTYITELMDARSKKTWTS